MTGLFQSGDFTLHSGDKSTWKIDCDALSDDDLASLAALASRNLPKFRDVVGIPRGGLRFAAALLPYAVLHSDTVLIVDDVLTTGASMKEMRSLKESQGYHTIGLVIFARKQPPTWVEPIFRAPFGWRQ